MTSLIPHRKEVEAAEKAEGKLFLRKFDPTRYSTYYRRIYDSNAYLSEIGIEKICELVEVGNNVLSLAEKLDISTGTLRRWIKSNPQHTNMFNEALVFAGEAFAYKAERVLKDAFGYEKVDAGTAAKLAEHYRWMAERLAKEQFGPPKKEQEKNDKPPLVLNLNLGGAKEPTIKTVNKPQPLVSSILNLSIPDES